MAVHQFLKTFITSHSAVGSQVSVAPMWLMPALQTGFHASSEPFDGTSWKTLHIAVSWSIFAECTNVCMNGWSGQGNLKRAFPGLMKFHDSVPGGNTLDGWSTAEYYIKPQTISFFYKVCLPPIQAADQSSSTHGNNAVISCHQK